MRIWLRLALCATIVGSPLAATAMVTLLQDDRLVSNTSGASDTPPVAFQAWTGGVGQANQTSSVAPSLFQATGSAETFSDVGFSAGSSKFDVTFSLSTPTQVDLTGELVFEDDAFATIIFASVLSDSSSTLFEGEDDPFFFDDQSGFPFEMRQDLAFADLLDPGTYRLLFDIDPSGGNGRGSFDFQLSLSPIPEPGTWALLAAGLLALGARRRTRR